MDYRIVIEKSPNNYTAYVPDLPGCVATGGTRREVTRNIREAITFHLDGVREDGDPIPAPSGRAPVVADDRDRRVG